MDNVFIWKYVVITMRAVGDEFLAEEVNSAGTAVLRLFVAIPPCSLCPGKNMDHNSSSLLLYIYIYI